MQKVTMKDLLIAAGEFIAIVAMGGCTLVLCFMIADVIK